MSFIVCFGKTFIVKKFVECMCVNTTYKLKIK